MTTCAKFKDPVFVYGESPGPHTVTVESASVFRGAPECRRSGSVGGAFVFVSNSVHIGRTSTNMDTSEVHIFKTRGGGMEDVVRSQRNARGSERNFFRAA